MGSRRKGFLSPQQHNREQAAQQHPCNRRRNGDMTLTRFPSCFVSLPSRSVLTPRVLQQRAGCSRESSVSRLIQSSFPRSLDTVLPCPTLNVSILCGQASDKPAESGSNPRTKVEVLEAGGAQAGPGSVQVPQEGSFLATPLPATVAPGSPGSPQRSFSIWSVFLAASSPGVSAPPQGAFPSGSGCWTSPSFNSFLSSRGNEDPSQTSSTWPRSPLCPTGHVLPPTKP